MRSVKAASPVKLRPPTRPSVGRRRSDGDSDPSLSRTRGATIPTPGCANTRIIVSTESGSSVASGLRMRNARALGAAAMARFMPAAYPTFVERMTTQSVRSSRISRVRSVEPLSTTTIAPESAPSAGPTLSSSPAT